MQIHRYQLIPTFLRDEGQWNSSIDSLPVKCLSPGIGVPQHEFCALETDRGNEEMKKGKTHRQSSWDLVEYAL